jgi:hypothetical protein
MPQDRIAEQVAGVVACSNAKGFQLEGRDGWLNLSKFATGVAAPERGAREGVGLDKSGFVRTVEPLLTIVNTPANEVLPIGTRPDREVCITRMACLNTATAVLTCSGPVDVADLLQLAGTLEEWVTRPRPSVLMPGKQPG